MRLAEDAGTPSSVLFAFPRRLLNRVQKCFSGTSSTVEITNASPVPQHSSELHVLENTDKITENIVEDAVSETGFGKYNFKIAVVCTLIYMDVAISLTSISFIMPAAACDFQMDIIDQGRLSTSMMIGMLCGSYFWGCLANVKGRRASILIASFLHTSCEVIASFTPVYWGFLCLKFISGIAMIGQFTLVYTYLGEFQPTKYRDRFLSWMEMAWILGFVVLPLIAWGIIPLKIDIRFKNFYFHSWNLFVLVCSLPGIMSILWFMTFPETPKYLADTGQLEQMLFVLSGMYAENTGHPRSKYIEKLKSSKNQALSSMVNGINEVKDQQHSTAVEKPTMRMIFQSVCSQTVMIARQPYFNKTLSLCLITYFSTSSYYALMLWLPGLFQKFAKFEERFPNVDLDICQGSHLLDDDEASVDEFNCNVPIQDTVYVQTLILGLACVPTAILMPLLIDRLGYFFFMISSALISCIVTIGLLFAKTSLQTLILSCIYEALTSICITIVACLAVDIYPTNLRSTAAGLSTLFARLGAIVGNSMFGYLINEYCVLLISIVAVQLFLSACFCLIALKETKSKKSADTADPEKYEPNYPT